ncbi:MAG: outer membrane beta-barrel protein [Polyangiaceae bacterium]
MFETLVCSPLARGLLVAGWLLIAPSLAHAQPVSPVTPEQPAEPPRPAQPAEPVSPPAQPAPAGEPPKGDHAPVNQAEAPPKRWYENIELSAFIDAYVSLNTNFPQPEGPTPTGGGNSFRAYDVNNGLSLHWIGADLSYAPEPIGATLGVRFGPSATIYAASDAAIHLENIKQAFATLKVKQFTLDFGKFDTFIGAEVADSQFNMNYTRGVLYWYAQPLFHTGFRVQYDFGELATLRAIVVNGWNDTLDDNAGKSGGLQLTIKGKDKITASLGYIIGPEQADTAVVSCPADTAFTGGKCVAARGEPGGDFDVAVDGANSRLKHIVDLVVDAKPVEPLRILANGDFGAEQQPGGDYALWYGAALAVGVTPAKICSLALRGEAYRDAQGYTTGVGTPITFFTGTLTANLSPVDQLSVFFDARLDGATQSVFQKRIEESAPLQFTTTLGTIVKTN